MHCTKDLTQALNYGSVYMRVLVCGGRDFTDWLYFREVMERIADSQFPRTECDEYGNYLYAVTVIHGDARGADSLADQWAVLNWTGIERYPADWKKYGKAAGPIRNQQMLDKGKPDLVVAFPGGAGTANMVHLAEKAGVRVIKVEAIHSDV